MENCYRVVPLHKKGSRTVLDNYRPISILPVIRKIFEKILYMSSYTNILPPIIYCLNMYRRTAVWVQALSFHITALLDRTDELYVNTDRGLYNFAVFLD
jgi:hypothetical protein